MQRKGNASLLAFLTTTSACLAVLMTLLSGTAQAQTSRDPYLWPFAQDSIWNIPIGSGANYVPANLGPLGYVLDDTEYFWKTTYSDPGRNVFAVAGFGPPRVPAGGPGTTSYQGFTYLPDDAVVPDATFFPYSTPNNAAAILQPDGRTLYQLEPFTRPNYGGDVYGYHWSIGAPTYGDLDIYGQGEGGSHFGSSLSALGGSIRRGELASGDTPIRHAIKIELDTEELYGIPDSEGRKYVWPATNADGDTSQYGVFNTSNSYQRMGALLAIPKTVDPSTLNFNTTAGWKLFYALQDYGGYIVDTSGAGYKPNGGYVFNICFENGVDAEFQAVNGYSINSGPGTGWFQDVQQLRNLLSIVSNNSPTSKGGGGVPLAPLAPPIGANPIPIGQTIALKATNGYLVSTDLSDSGNLKAAFATGTPGTWERFRVDDAGNGQIALFSLNNNRYVTVYDNDPNKALRADYATSINYWEQFTWETLPGTNRVALKSAVTGKYVTCNLNDNGRLIAPWASSVQGWEEFEWSAL